MRTSAVRRSSDAHRRWMRQLLALPFVGVVIWDGPGAGGLRANDRFRAMVRLGREELGRATFAELCHPEDRARVRETETRVAAGRATHVKLAVRLALRDGTVLPVEADIDRANGGTHLVALVSQAPAQELTAISMFRDAHSPMLVLEPGSWNVLDANPAAERFYGWSLAEFRSRGLRAWDVSDSSRARVSAALAAAAAGTVQVLEGAHHTAAGERRDVEVHCGPVSVGGRPCVYAIVHDRTELHRARAQQQEAEETLHAVVEQSIAGIYIVEDGRFRYANRRMAEMFGYAPGELDGLPILEIVAPQDHALVTRNMRRRIDGEVDSLQYEFHGRRKDGGVVDVGAHGSVTVLRGKRVIIGVAQDITERRRAQQRLDNFHAKTQAALRGAIGALSHMVDLRDPYTAGHERRVAGVAEALSRRLGVPDDDVRAVVTAAQVHDIGKISVPSEILSKPARLSTAEFEIIKLHAPNGYDILKTVDFPWPVAQITAQHHERLDGSGYPYGLKNGDICAGARILAVADVIEAMASHRPYRASLGTAPALAEIERGAGRAYDADVAACALRMFRDEGFRIPD